MIRVAAVGDIHLGPDSRGLLRPAFDTLPDHADLLLLAGDLTRHGTPEEARVVAEEVAGLPVPVIAVLGNHDHHAERPEDVTAVLRDAGVTVLEGEGTVGRVDGVRVGVAGTKGFGGGFAGRSGSEFGEPEMKAFVRHTRGLADGLRRALDELAEDGCAVRIALTHFAPVPDTLVGEPLEIYPFLGSYLGGGDGRVRRRPRRPRPRPSGYRARHHERWCAGAQCRPARHPACLRGVRAAGEPGPRFRGGRRVAPGGVGAAHPATGVEG